jgi:hypothetical protein
MAGGPIGAHVDETRLPALKELVAAENRPASRGLAIVLKFILACHPAAAERCSPLTASPRSRSAISR